MTGTIGDMCLVEHACLVPDSADHLWEVTASWMAGGLAAGERVVYFEDDSADLVLSRLADDRVSVDDALATDQLLIVPTDTTRAAAALPVEEITGLMRGQIDRTAEGGWAGLRLSGESGAMLPRGGIEKVVAYEQAVDRLLQEHPTARMLCRYDRRWFDDDAVSRLRAVHHTELVTVAVYDDTLLRVTNAGPSVVRLSGEIDHSNRPEIRRVLDAALDAALRSASAPPDITVDVSSLRFLDVGGAVELVHTAEEFPEGHRLVVVGPRPRVARVLDRCGAPFAPRLLVRPRPGQPGRP